MSTTTPDLSAALLGVSASSETPKRSILVAPAAPADAEVAARTLASAYSLDPYITGLLPKGGLTRRLQSFFRAMVGEAMATGGHVYLAKASETADPLGVAIWAAPGETRGSWNRLKRTRAYADAFGKRLPEAMRCDRELKRHRPAAENWYLRAMGTRPTARGLGVGTELLSDRLRRADADGVGVYLETANPECVLYYRRHGFRERSVVPGHGTVSPTGMWRAPR